MPPCVTKSFTLGCPSRSLISWGAGQMRQGRRKGSWLCVTVDSRHAGIRHQGLRGFRQRASPLCSEAACGQRSWQLRATSITHHPLCSQCVVTQAKLPHRQTPRQVLGLSSTADNGHGRGGVPLNGRERR
jgi:hypothetical protein